MKLTPEERDILIEEFTGKFFEICRSMEHGQIKFDSKKTAEWWLQKINEILEKREKDIVEMIESKLESLQKEYDESVWEKMVYEKGTFTREMASFKFVLRKIINKINNI